MEKAFTRTRGKELSTLALGRMECDMVTANSNTKMAQYTKVNGSKVLKKARVE